MWGVHVCCVDDLGSHHTQKMAREGALGGSSRGLASQGCWIRGWKRVNRNMQSNMQQYAAICSNMQTGFHDILFFYANYTAFPRRSVNLLITQKVSFSQGKFVLKTIFSDLMTALNKSKTPKNGCLCCLKLLT